MGREGEGNARYPVRSLLISSRFVGIRTEVKGRRERHDDGAAKEEEKKREREDSSDLARKGFCAFEAHLLERSTLIHDDQSSLSSFFSSSSSASFLSFIPLNNEVASKCNAPESL